MKKKRNITILAIGDSADFDTYKKFHREKKLLAHCGFEYLCSDYRHFLNGRIPPIKTDKVVIFLFFPFYYWDRHIEHKNYRGTYGNRTFFRKFGHFWNRVEETLKRNLKDKKIFLVNPPRLCGLYRDKLAVLKKLSLAGIPTPRLYNGLQTREIRGLLGRGMNFFIKPRYGSMGKGITYVSWCNWQTNFIYRSNKIISRRSDYGWKFRNITGNRAFLSRLLKKDILIEQAVDSLVLKDMKVDLRIYTFLKKVIYVYPRRNEAGKITTNISQGGRGDPGLLEILPEGLVARARRVAEKASRALDLNLAGIDLVLDRNLKDVYVIDVNVFPGFPRRRTFKLARSIINDLGRENSHGKLRYQKGIRT